MWTDKFEKWVGTNRIIENIEFKIQLNLEQQSRKRKAEVYPHHIQTIIESRSNTLINSGHMWKTKTNDIFPVLVTVGNYKTVKRVLESKNSCEKCQVATAQAQCRATSLAYIFLFNKNKKRKTAVKKWAELLRVDNLPLFEIEFSLPIKPKTRKLKEGYPWYAIFARITCSFSARHWCQVFFWLSGFLVHGIALWPVIVVYGKILRQVRTFVDYYS